MRRRRKKSACTIFISCEEPSEDGKMEVEMTCEGDRVLAAYILENAQAILDDPAPSASNVSSISN